MTHVCVCRTSHIDILHFWLASMTVLNYGLKRFNNSINNKNENRIICGVFVCAGAGARMQKSIFFLDGELCAAYTYEISYQKLSSVEMRRTSVNEMSQAHALIGGYVIRNYRYRNGFSIHPHKSADFTLLQNSTV